METSELQKIAKRLRIHALKMSTNAGSGHPTTALSCADIAATLFFDEMHMNVEDHNDPGNDEMLFSKGHASPLIWGLYKEAGMLKEDLMTYRKFGSILEGHPTPRFPWVRAATGSLGQGLSISLGMAIAQQMQKRPGRTYCIMGDGELAEGSVWEAAMLAAKRKQSNLCAIADINRLAQSDPTMFEHDMEGYAKKFSAFGWHTIVIDGHDIDEIKRAFQEAKNTTDKPSILLCKTFKGKGVSFLEDKEGWHGKALDEEKLHQALAELGDMPELTAKVKSAHQTDVKVPNCELPSGLDNVAYEKDTATRQAFGNALVKLGACPAITALDGDVKNSTFTLPFFEEFPERSVECYIAEQNMMGVAVGLQALGHIPFAATFAAFHSRSFDFVRMAGISMANLKLCGSHVGVSIGEDGPSQMALEDLALFRSVINSTVVYPSDPIAAEKLTLEIARQKGIAYMRTSRPKTPTIYKESDEFRIGGSKVLRQSERDVVTVVTAGVTVHEALKAADELKEEGINIRVIDAYSVKPLDVQTIRASAEETGFKVIVVEDHYAEGGLGEAVATQAVVPVKHLCIREIPRSGKANELMAAYGIDAQAIIEAIKGGKTESCNDCSSCGCH